MIRTNALKITLDGKSIETENYIPKEFFAQLFVNGKWAFTLTCSHQYMEELAIGRLIAEGIITSMEQVNRITISESKENIYVEINERECELETKDVFAGEEAMARDNLKPFSGQSFENEWIFTMAKAFVKGGKIHQKTRGAHSCMVSVRGEILFSCEDIGRHNAMDKVIGYIYKNGIAPSECILFTTGRIPTEMAIKAIRARIPILVSKAVPTDKTMLLAKKYNLRLICKAWPDSFEVFQ